MNFNTNSYKYCVSELIFQLNSIRDSHNNETNWYSTVNCLFLGLFQFGPGSRRLLSLISSSLLCCRRRSVWMGWWICHTKGLQDYHLWRWQGQDGQILWTRSMRCKWLQLQKWLHQRQLAAEFPGQ